MLKLNKNTRFQYVATLPEETQQTIKKAVTKTLKTLDYIDKENINEYLEDAMNSKVIDLEDTIQIKYI